MEVGDVVVLLHDVDGIEAGQEGRVMGVRQDMVMVGCRTRERLQVVMARTWELLPERMFRRVCEREKRKMQ